MKHATARDRVLSYIARRKRNPTRAEVVRGTKLHYSTATNRVTDLIRDGLVVETGMRGGSATLEAVGVARTR